MLSLIHEPKLWLFRFTCLEVPIEASKLDRSQSGGEALREGNTGTCPTSRRGHEDRESEDTRQNKNPVQSRRSAEQAQRGAGAV